MLDCLIIGGGPAGLTAALYLGRYGRDTLLVDAGASRLQLIPKSRNVPGFPDGVAGGALWELLRKQSDLYGVPRREGRVEELQAVEGGFTARLGAQTLRARRVLLATGAADVAPELAGLDAALQKGHVRYCPICDGYETRGQRVAVLGRGEHGLREALFVAGFDNRVTWLSLGSQDDAQPGSLAQARERGVLVAQALPEHIDCAADCGVRVSLPDGRALEFDVMYPALGITHASELALALGARVQPDGQLEVDDHLRTTVARLWAAGDVAAGLNQVSVACGQAAIAATDIHNSL